MPRLPPSLVRLATCESPFLALVLCECRDLPSARNELRWLREHALLRSRNIGSGRSSGPLTAKITVAAAAAAAAATSRLPRRSRSRAVIPAGRSLLRRYVERRCRGEPLQYILGSQPFGELEILCKPGVLIPRSDTETYTEKVGCLVGEFLEESEQKKKHTENKEGDEAGVAGGEPHDLGKGRLLRALDLCTGTGCIPLKIYEMLSSLGQQGCGRKKEWKSKIGLEVLGLDISLTAVRLARRNLLHNIELGHIPRQAAHDVGFIHADVLPSSSLRHDTRGTTAPSVLDALQVQRKNRRLEIDVLTANPPYISPAKFSPASGNTARSVRKFEPRLALVPASTINPPSPRWSSDTTPTAGDEFYHHLLPLADRLNAGLTVLEVGDTAQAHRVLELARRRAAAATADEQSAESVLEVWFDDGSTEALTGQNDTRLKVDDQRSTTIADKLGRVPPGQHDPEHPERPEINARVVVIWRREWAEWRRRQSIAVGAAESDPA